MAAVLNAALKLYTGLLATHVRDRLTGKAHKLLMERMNYYKANWVTHSTLAVGAPRARTNQHCINPHQLPPIQQLSPHQLPLPIHSAAVQWLQPCARGMDHHHTAHLGVAQVGRDKFENCDQLIADDIEKFSSALADVSSCRSRALLLTSSAACSSLLRNTRHCKFTHLFAECLCSSGEAVESREPRTAP